jgi:protein subunit release factor A
MSTGKKAENTAKSTFRKRDLRVELYVAKNANLSESVKLMAKAAVRVTHLPTGLRAVGRGQGSQIENHERALEILERKVRRFLKSSKVKLRRGKK